MDTYNDNDNNKKSDSSSYEHKEKNVYISSKNNDINDPYMEVFNELIEYFKDCCKTISKVSEGRTRCKINFPIITFSCVKPVVKFNFEIFDKSKLFIFFEKNGLGRPQFTLFF